MSKVFFKSKTSTADYRMTGATGAETEKRENRKSLRVWGNQLKFK